MSLLGVLLIIVSPPLVLILLVALVVWGEVRGSDRPRSRRVAREIGLGLAVILTVYFIAWAATGFRW